MKRNRLFFLLTRDVLYARYAHTDSWDAIYRVINASVDSKVRANIYAKTNVIAPQNRQITQYINATNKL